AGIAQGEMTPLAETGLRADLAWGAPLVLSLSLARIAKIGEVLLHSSLGAANEGTLSTLEARDDSDRGYDVSGMRLDCKNPWRERRSRPHVEAATPLATPPSPAMAPPPPPAGSTAPTQGAPPPPVPPPRPPSR